ncbi:MAG: DNA-processing protein DprA [bacterium]|nr:DNA-processing protein DprA [bacterium]
MRELGDLRSDRALLVAVCEALARHMNGRGMWRLTFLLEELALDPAGGGLIPEDREWLEAGVARAAGRRGHWESELARLAGVGVAVVACTDAAFPLNLRLVHDAPPLLFVRGTLVDEDRRAVAIVGTRSPSAAGRALAGRLAAGAVESGYTVVAGLAAGIDTAAQVAAVNAGGRTIAVFGTDIERVYPAANRALASAVRRSGACVSQFLPGTGGARWSFPARNLTTSGLAMATVVVEASETSGARHQAEAAIAHGRPVFLLDALVTAQPWAEEMADGPGDVTVVGGAEEITRALDAHLAIVDADSFAFA